LITAGVVDIVQPDVTRVGGITEWMKIAHFASAHGLKVAPHGVFVHILKPKVSTFFTCHGATF
jgi:L-alanine-DL-glutamate epimerase-like enolase superfamily enzyme